MVEIRYQPKQFEVRGTNWKWKKQFTSDKVSQPPNTTNVLIVNDFELQFFCVELVNTRKIPRGHYVMIKVQTRSNKLHDQTQPRLFENAMYHVLTYKSVVHPDELMLPNEKLEHYVERMSQILFRHSTLQSWIREGKVKVVNG